MVKFLNVIKNIFFGLHGISTIFATLSFFTCIFNNNIKYIGLTLLFLILSIEFAELEHKIIKILLDKF